MPFELSWDPSLVALLAVVGAALGLIGLVLGVASWVRLRRLRRAYTLLQSTDGGDSFVDVVVRQTAEVAALRLQVDEADARVDALHDDIADALRHVAVVRYDAFGDMGGRISFSAALLDDGGDGLIFTSINGRSETRTYAKGVKAGSSEQALSPEEQQAVDFARRTKD